MLFPFLTNWKRPRTGGADASYRAVSTRSDDNQQKVYEAHQGPPVMDIMGYGVLVGQNGGPQPALFAPFVESPVVQYPITAGQSAGVQLTGLNPLFTVPDSNPTGELF